MQQKSSEGTIPWARGGARGAGSSLAPFLREHSVGNQTLGNPPGPWRQQRAHSGKLQGDEVTLWQYLLGLLAEQAVPSRPPPDVPTGVQAEVQRCERQALLMGAGSPQPPLWELPSPVPLSALVTGKERWWQRLNVGSRWLLPQGDALT